jgi:pyruvate carboxylase
LLQDAIALDRVVATIIAEEKDFVSGDFDTSYLETHPLLFVYEEDSSEVGKLARLIADIHFRKKNAFAV